MSEEFHVVQPAAHNALVEAAYLHRGFNQHESEAAARFRGIRCEAWCAHS